MRTLSRKEFLAELDAQNVPRLHVALKCCSCGHVQSMASLMEFAGLDSDAAGEAVIQECEGRHNPGCGCDWTTTGLLRTHTLEVIDDDGKPFAVFEPASATEAQALMAKVIAHNQARGE